MVFTNNWANAILYDTNQSSSAIISLGGGGEEEMEK